MLACLSCVQPDLPGQRFEVGIVTLLAQALQEFNPHHPAIKIAVKIEQVHFEQQLAILLDSRSAAQARHRGPGTVCDTMDLDDENPLYRRVREWNPDVQRWKAQFAAQFSTVHDMPTDGVAAPHQAIGLLKVSSGQGVAYCRTRYALPVLGDGVEAGEFEPQACSGLLEHRPVAPALCAEAEIVADQQVPGLKAFDDDPIDEILRGNSGEACIEVRDTNAVDAMFGQRIEFVALSQNTSRSSDLVGGQLRKVFTWMRLEGQHAGRYAKRVSPLPESGQDRLVSAMHAVEIADRQRTGSALFGGWQQAKDFHGFGKTLNYKAFRRSLGAAEC